MFILNPGIFFLSVPIPDFVSSDRFAWTGPLRLSFTDRQMRPDVSEASCAIEWIAYASNAFNTMVPFYANVERTPEYLANTTGTVSTDNFYWVSRMIAAMADASYAKSLFHIERYEEAVLSAAHALVNQYDAKLAAAAPAARAALREEANLALAAMIQEKASDTLGKVLFELSNQMKNAYPRSDA